MTAVRTPVIVACALAALAGLGAARTVLAHHSQTQYEPKVTISVEGSLKRATWANPHTLFIIEGKKVGSDEAPKEWTAEGPSPRQLEATGWGRTVSKIGDKLIVEGRQRRDGQPELLLLKITVESGKTFSVRPD